MKYRIHGHRHADFLFRELGEYACQWSEIEDALASISDDMIVREFEGEARKAKSISQAINRLVKAELVKRAWEPESYIFADEEYGRAAKGTWRLDFAKAELSVEVAFNHRSDISWNLIKPTLASELNHVQKAIQTSGGVVITATQAMKEAGGFDSAVGTFEDYVQYLRPLGAMLPAPLVIVGLEPPETFRIAVEDGKGSSRVGRVMKYAATTPSGEFACPDCGCVLAADACGVSACACGECGRGLIVPDSLF